MPVGCPVGHKRSEETKQRMRAGALQRSSRIIGRYGYTAEVVNAAIAEGKEFCSSCKLFRESEFFGNQKIRTRCLPCGRELGKRMRKEKPEKYNGYHQKWAKNNPDKIRAQGRKQNLRQYGVDEAWYEAKLEEQGGHCALCLKTKGAGRGYLFVDHNHATGKTRGLLCETCNFHLHSIEKPGWGKAALSYIERYGDLLDGDHDDNASGERPALPD